MYPVLFSIGNVNINSYGLMIGLGIIAAYLLAEFRAKRRGVDADPIFNIAVFAVLAGIVGAKLLFYIVEIKSIIANPRLLLDFGNGYVLYGGVIAGILTAFWYCRRKKLDFPGYFDLLIPSVPLAQGFGRIGCFLAGCCYGQATDGWCGMVFPTMPGIRVVPTQLLSAIGDFAIVALLLLLSGRQKFKGQIAAGYLLLYGAGRFVIEFWRDDPRGAVGTLSTSQFISVFIFAAGLAMYLLGRKKGTQPGVIPPEKPDQDAEKEDPPPDEGSDKSSPTARDTKSDPDL